MSKKTLTVCIFIFIFIFIFYIAGCSPVINKNSSNIKKANAPSHQASKDYEMTPMKYKEMDVVVSRYDKGPAFKNERFEKATRLSSIPKSVKQVVLRHEKSKPTPHTLNADKLAACSLVGQRTEFDNNPATFEWLVTTSDKCSNPSPKRLKTIWIAQLGQGAGKVILVDRGHWIYSYREGKSLTTQIKVISWTQQPADFNSGTTIASKQTPLNCTSKWVYNKGHITKMKDWGKFYVIDPMLPQSMPNLGVPANQLSESIGSAMQRGTFTCPKR